MNRPAKHNAFNPTLIKELTNAFLAAGADSKVRAVVLTGEGTSFSAGADLEWMSEMGSKDEATNLASAKEMAKLFATIELCPKPVIARIQGAALGGGTGLVCSSDIAIAGPRAVFGFTEVRLGLVAGVISPYALRRLGYSQAKAKMLTGERFKAEEALRIGLVHQYAEDLDQAVSNTIVKLLEGSSQAQAASKKLLAEINELTSQQQLEPTALAIAIARASQDGREGLSAFIEKRPPAWHSGP